MSDELKKYDFKKFKGGINVDKNHSLQYLRKQTVNANEIVSTIHITNKILKSWHDIRQTVSCSFVEILNCFLAENFAISVKKDNKISIDDHLYTKTGDLFRSRKAILWENRLTKMIYTIRK